MADLTDPEAGAAVEPVAPPVPPPVPAAIPPPAPEVHSASFTGRGAEYFRIWIVNLTLTVLTLGVYSAWAKVRRQQFFYRHTRLAGSGFDYHGNPIAILKGRLVGLVLFGLYSAVTYVGIELGLLIVTALAIVMPWLLARSIRFQLHNSSYRGIRFVFDGRTAGAYWVFLGLPVLTVFSLFLVGPLWHHRIKRYQIAHASYGSTRFRFGAETARFYLAYLGASVASGIALFAAMIPILVAVVMSGTGGDPGEPSGLMLTGILAAYAVAVVAFQSITTAVVQNATWSTTGLSGHRFVSKLQWPRLFAIQFTNLLATIVTIGLFRPFGQVRLARYVASAFVLVSSGAFEDLRAADVADVGAAGEETAGLFDLEVGL